MSYSILRPGQPGKARHNAKKVGADNLRVFIGIAENLPVLDQCVDLLISNGVINLCPDKKTVFQEIYRVLKPGGRLQIADVLLENPVPSSTKDLIHLQPDDAASLRHVTGRHSQAQQAGLWVQEEIPGREIQSVATRCLLSSNQLRATRGSKRQDFIAAHQKFN